MPLSSRLILRQFLGFTEEGRVGPYEGWYCGTALFSIDGGGEGMVLGPPGSGTVVPPPFRSILLYSSLGPCISGDTTDFPFSCV